MDVVNELLSATSDFAVQHPECGPLPTSRVGVMDDILKMGAAGRKTCWTKDIAVFSDNDETIEWVRDLGGWDDESDSDMLASKALAKEAAEDAEFFEAAHLEAPVVHTEEEGSELSRQSSASAMRLHRLRARFDALEAQNNQIIAVGEDKAKEAQLGLRERSSLFQATLVEHEARLREALDDITVALAELDAPAELEAPAETDEGLLATPSSGRDAALALAWMTCARRFAEAQASELVAEEVPDGAEETAHVPAAT